MPFCKKCGCFLEDSYNNCPSCGEIVGNKQPSSHIVDDATQERGPWKGFAIASFPTSIVGLCFSFLPYLCIYGFLISSTALVLAILGLKSANKHGYALAGLIISCVALGMIVLIILACTACIFVSPIGVCAILY